MRKSLISIFKRCLTPRQYELAKKLYTSIFCLFNTNDLMKLAAICRTDKWGEHWYARHYQEHFRRLRKKRMNVLEIGVGGYEDPDKGGASLLMWKYYFPRSAIYAIDVYDKSKLQEKRIKIFQGSQNDEKFLKDVFSRIGSLDIIIDDGSHMNEHVLTSFKTLFPLLKDGGIYAVEDVQTSYWPQYGGSSEDLNNPATAMGFFKKIADGLNYMELAEPGYEPAYFDRNITSIHFYHNLVIIYKGVNDERSIGRPRASGDPIK
ncbi:MAG: class I SAM-dependent methyltransferase [Candidatus Omnitrophica bacterium]|nr:class I SAM-dependent methyltransferase [Candidatus Omnitrophota bacterium]